MQWDNNVETVRMLDLPSPPRYRMSDAPLAQALVHVMFPIVPRLRRSMARR
jgi:hypothetical protein